jgi:hypothetical protein
MAQSKKKIDLALQTLFSELETRAHDAQFIEDFDKSGSFLKKKRWNKYYWYWQYRKGAKTIQKYVGKFTSKDITDRVERFEQLKSNYDARRAIVKSLIAGGLPTPDAFSGEVVRAMGKAGFFRLRGVLVGTTAYQCYSGMLGYKLSAATLGTQDADFAQFFAISQKIDDKMPPILDVLREVAADFREVPHLSDPAAATAFVSDKMKYKVEFLTPNRGSDNYGGKPARMPALGGASAEPLRFLDFLIREPTKTVILHDDGVAVTVPTPERYAIHKLIVSDRRRASERSKIEKDLKQAETLIDALSERHSYNLFEAWQEAWDRGPGWKEALLSGVDQIDREARSLLDGSGGQRCQSPKARPIPLYGHRSLLLGNQLTEHELPRPRLARDRALLLPAS